MKNYPESPMPFESLTKVEGDSKRHIEQLWDEIQKLKARVTMLETNEKYDKKMILDMINRLKMSKE